MKCERCNNTLFWNPKKKDYRECSYCIWKGDIGPGATLKEIIRNENAKRKEATHDTHGNL